MALWRRPVSHHPSIYVAPLPFHPLHAPTIETAPAPPPSPTISVPRLILTLAIAMVLAVLFGARGLVHAGEGMPDGPFRTATLAVGNRVLAISEAAHLTIPWDAAQAALGRAQQTSAPLLAVTPPPATPLPSPTPRTVPPAVAGSGPHHTLSKPTATATPKPTPKPTPRPTVALRVPTPHNPLRVLTTGDSLMGYLGPELVDELSHVGPIRGFVDVHDGTGLTRPDFVDWSVVARQQIAADNPDAIVVLIGGNDFQNMTLGNRVFIAGTPAWTREYQRRAEICMRIWTSGDKRRLYWLSMPPARDPSWAYDDARINQALQRAAAHVPGARYINILGPITNHGRYTDFVNVGGQPTLIREPDGVHLNIAGSDIVAHEVRPLIAKEWHLSWHHAKK